MTSVSFDICQIAYHVPDIRQAAAEWAATFGAGPFFVVDNIELAWAQHRGEPCPFVHSSAYGQWGAIMLELVQQEGAGDSPFRDLYTPEQSGIHHVATMVTSLPDAIATYEEAGIPLATRAMTTGGTEFVFLDAIASRGHFIEVYERTDALEAFYQRVRAASENWSGSNPIRITA